eukprot:5450193-Pyramimonas_sp.AAC.1
MSCGLQGAARPRYYRARAKAPPEKRGRGETMVRLKLVNPPLKKRACASYVCCTCGVCEFVVYRVMCMLCVACSVVDPLTTPWALESPQGRSWALLDICHRAPWHVEACQDAKCCLVGFW